MIPFLLSGQQSFKTILKENSKKNFKEIIEEGEQYFTKKYPTKSKQQLSLGEFRDGEYVKFMRWQSFWKNRLDENGNLADLSEHKRKNKQNTNGLKAAGDYSNVQWENISYDQDLGVQIGLGRTNAIAFHPTDPNIFYVGAAIGGIWKTSDGGQTYVPLGDELPYLAVSSIVVDQDNPNTIYISISDRVWYGPGGIGVYKSIDGGQNWNPTALSFDFADQIQIYWMVADPTNPSKMFVGSSDGLYLTSNGFSTINKLADGTITDVKFKPNNSNIVYYVNRDNGTFHKSTNGGLSFVEKNNFGSNTYMRIATTNLNPEKIYISHNNILHKSQNSGESFTTTSDLSRINNAAGIVMFSPMNENQFYAGNFDMHWSSNDDSNYSQISYWLGNSNLPLIHVDQRNAFVNPLQNDRIYICNDGGIYILNVSNNQFTNLSNGLVITQYFDIATAQSNPVVMSGGSQDNGNVFREANGVWRMAAPTADGMMQAIDPTDENIRYNAIQNGNIFRYINGSGVDISLNIPNGEAGTGEWVTPFILDPSNPNRIVAGYDRVYESNNQGNNWTDISGQIAGGSNIDFLAIAPSNSNRIYALENFGTGTGDMFGNGQTNTILYVKNTNNNGWTQQSLPVTENVQELAVDLNDMNTIYIVVAGFQAGEKVFKSTDAGANWVNISGSLPNVPCTAIELYGEISGSIFVGTDEGIFYRDDTMTDWEEYGNFPNTYITDIEIQKSSQLIRVGTHGRGILQATLPINDCLTDNPTDSDGDGVCDGFDICPGGDDNVDLNGDGSPDFCDEYCTASGASGTGGDWIDFVELNTIQNSSTKTSYSDFTNLSTDLERGQTYILTLGLNYAFPPDIPHAWIDYNQDIDFDDANETLNMPAFDGNHHSIASFTIPLNAKLGSTVLRVRNVYDGVADPCNSYFGEVEDYTVNIIDNNSTNITLNVKGNLQGPYNSTQNLMNDDLRQKGFIPLKEPYNAIPIFQHNGSEQTTQAVLNQTGTNAIVDWVLLELRSKTNSSQIVASRAALIQRDGDVVDVDGISSVNFPIPADEYYVALRHRNHLGVMTNQSIAIGSETVVDFQTSTTSTWGLNAQKNLIGTKMGLWAGNSNSDTEIIFQGANNDPNNVFFDVLLAPNNTGTNSNFIHEGYYASDINLDGEIIYQGADNEPNLIFFNVLTNSGNSSTSTNYIIQEQLP